jgi:hypothetical protein
MVGQCVVFIPWFASWEDGYNGNVGLWGRDIWGLGSRGKSWYNIVGQVNRAQLGKLVGWWLKDIRNIVGIRMGKVFVIWV